MILFLKNNNYRIFQHSEFLLEIWSCYVENSFVTIANYLLFFQ